MTWKKYKLIEIGHKRYQALKFKTRTLKQVLEVNSNTKEKYSDNE